MELEKLNPKAIAKAVELWKGLLGNPKYDNMGDTGTPEERRTQGMASLLANMIPKNNQPEVLDAFGVRLTDLLSEATSYPGSPFTLSVDYGPDHTLREAAERASLRMEFPWKTVMWIHQDRVELQAGYAAPIQTFAVESELPV